MEGFGDFGGKKVAAPEDVAKMKAALEELRNAMVGSEDDPDQNALVKVIQRNRAFLLEYALSAYIDNPKNAKLLEGVTQIIAQIEKVVRDDRKEALKKKDQDTNKVGFNQMMEALQNISNGSVRCQPSTSTSLFLIQINRSSPTIARWIQLVNTNSCKVTSLLTLKVFRWVNSTAKHSNANNQLGDVP